MLIRSCCCFDLHGGAVASAIYTLTICVLGIVLQTQEYLLGLTEANTTSTQGIQRTLDTFKCVAIAQYVRYSTMVILSVIMLIGVNKEKRKLLLPWICGMVLYIITEIILQIWAAILEATEKKYGVVVGTLLVMLLFLALDIYCLLCVISHYQELGYEEHYARILTGGENGRVYHYDDAPPSYNSTLPPSYSEISKS
ncbi:uncharacterized protein [Ptychodera flava]|uniref:uncharacterized protein n=1 Tax=Ptychodera flava TaxID=63121 RepID=UPI00396A1C28